MPSRNPKRRAARSKREGAVLDHLKPDEAAEVLRRLLAAHPDLADEAERTARSVLGEVTFEEIANEVEDAVRAPHLDDLNGRAGRHEGGYVEPTEAAWAILEEAVEPFVEDMKRRTALGLEPQALEICKGVVLGLYRVEHGKGGGVLEWAPDFPAEAAGNAVEVWYRGGDRVKKRARRTASGGHRGFPREFVEQVVPEWAEMISRILSRKMRP
ncbi:MAG: hypothetical protein HYS14_04375 [Candidatus Rokubacteria bacterium]|nr:hypothetical protein [Candidatus Rokubacteria bacterium]